MVDASQKLDVAIRQIAGKISGLVKTACRIALNGLAINFSSSVRTVEISPRQTISSNMEFSATPMGTGLQMSIENVDLRVANRPTNGHGRQSSLHGAGFDRNSAKIVLSSARRPLIDSVVGLTAGETHSHSVGMESASPPIKTLPYP